MSFRALIELTDNAVNRIHVQNWTSGRSEFGDYYDFITDDGSTWLSAIDANTYKTLDTSAGTTGSYYTDVNMASVSAISAFNYTKVRLLYTTSANEELTSEFIYLDNVSNFTLNETVAINNYDAATYADVSGLATSAQINALNDLSEAQVSGQVNESLSAYETCGVAGYIDVTGASATASQSAMSGAVDMSLTAYDGPTHSEVSGFATSGQVAGLNDLSTADIDARLSAYPVAFSGQVEALNDLSESQISGQVNESLSAYETTGVASKYDVTGTSISQAEISAAVDLSLSAYESTGVASKDDLHNISGVTASISQEDKDDIITGVSGAIVSGIGTWGDLRWSKIYGIPLQQWDIIVMEEDDSVP